MASVIALTWGARQTVLLIIATLIVIVLIILMLTKKPGPDATPGVAEPPEGEAGEERPEVEEPGAEEEER